MQTKSVVRRWNSNFNKQTNKIMKRYIRILGEDREVPEVDAFLAEIKQVCEKHKLWISIQSDYEGYDIGVTSGRDMVYDMDIMDIPDHRKLPEWVAEVDANVDLLMAEKEERRKNGTLTESDKMLDMLYTDWVRRAAGHAFGCR